MMLRRIVSGGQTGVDRVALDAALAASFPCGGRCPEGRMAEDGVIPHHYPVTVLRGADHADRTTRNVKDSDGTVIFFNVGFEGGSKLTHDVWIRENQPVLLVNAGEVLLEGAVQAVSGFVREHRISILNFAGPRASGWPGGHRFAIDVVGGLIRGR